MTALQPQELCDALLNEISKHTVISTHYLTPTDPVYLGWLDKAETLRGLHLEGARAFVMAHIAPVAGNVYLMESSIGDARRHGIENSLIHAAQMFGYTNLAYATKARGAFVQAVDISKSNLSELIHIGVCIGSILRVDELIEQATNARLDLGWPNAPAWKRAAAILKEVCFSDELGAKIIDIVGEVLRPRSLFWLDMHPRVMPDEEQGTVLVRYRVSVTPYEAAKMNGEVVEKLVHAGLDKAPLLVNFVGVNIASKSE